MPQSFFLSTSRYYEMLGASSTGATAQSIRLLSTTPDGTTSAKSVHRCQSHTTTSATSSNSRYILLKVHFLRFTNRIRGVSWCVRLVMAKIELCCNGYFWLVKCPLYAYFSSKWNWSTGNCSTTAENDGKFAGRTSSSKSDNARQNRFCSLEMYC